MVTGVWKDSLVGKVFAVQVLGPMQKSGTVALVSSPRSYVSNPRASVVWWEEENPQKFMGYQPGVHSSEPQNSDPVSNKELDEDWHFRPMVYTHTHTQT